jgi:small-conductance mechanosensitive channel
MWRIDGFTRELTGSDLIRAGAYLVGFFLVGLLLYRLLLSRVKRRVSLTTWGGDDIVLGAIHDVALIWFAAAGAFFAANSLPLSLGIAHGIDRALLAIVIVTGTWVAVRLVSDIIKLFALRADAVSRGSSILLNIARVAIVLVGALILMQSLGVQIGALLAAVGVGGLAIALALQEPLKNFFAGMQILATKKVRPGQFVRLDTGEEGYIVDIDWRHTSIRQLANNMVLVPNARLADAVITNFYYPTRELSVSIDVGVGYDSDMEAVERITVEVAREVQQQVAGAVKRFDPFIRYHTFDDWRIRFTAILRVAEFTDQYLIRHEFMKRLKARYDGEGIKMPSPTQTITLEGRSDLSVRRAP